MSTSAFLAELRALDIRVWLDGDQIRCSAPKGALTPDLREQLRVRREALRETLRGLVAPNPAPVVRERDASAAAPLSLAQERLWFFHELEPESAAYNMSVVLTLTGPLDVAALEGSLSAIVARHAILRTTFEQQENGEPRQRVHPAESRALAIDDLSLVDPTGREREAEALWRREAETPFDLAAVHPIRTRLIRLGAESHHLVITLHHIAADGVSLVLLIRELVLLYGAQRGSAAPMLPALPIQYADYAERQRDWIRSSASDRALNYWTTRLGGELPVLDLPTDHVRPALQSYRGGLCYATLSRETSAALRALSRRHSATVFMTLLAGFKTLLYRHSGEEDVIVGTPVAGRAEPDVANLVGMFVNTVALRSDLAGNPSFQTVLDRVKETCLAGFANDAIPFARLLEVLRPERDLSRSPVFQVMFNMFTMETEEVVRVDGLEIKPPSLERLATAFDSESKFDLTLYARDHADGTRLTLVYNADLFSSERMDAFIEQYVRLLDTVATAPQARIGDVRLTTASAVQPLARAMHSLRTAPFTSIAPGFVQATIGDRFADIAARQPDALAVVTSTGQWTYAQLAAHATRLAHVVNAVAGGTTRVGLLCDHDEPMMAAMLGVLMQGSAYVPLSPAFPEARLAALLDDAGATVVLADPQHRALAERVAGPSRRVCTTDAAVPPNSGALPSVAADSIAYILYTSGSSGEPKGISQTQGNVLHYVRGYVNAVELTPEDRLTLVASYTFDASVVDIFSGLLAGATLYPVQLLTDGLDGIAETLKRQRVSVFHCTPTLYRAIGPHLDRVATSSIRCVVLGGEQVHPRDFERFQTLFDSRAVFVNLYGASEVTIASMMMLAGNAANRARAVELGDPIEDTDVLLVDDAGQPTAVRGEIAVRSPHLAIGYWNSPALTRRAFLPTAGDSVRRLYRTGDLGRRRPDGTIEYLGRKDKQIKIRGVRIEPGEVEAVLASHPAVAECVVVADRSRDAGPMLVAFVVLGSKTTSADELKAYLAKSLPEYMVPAAIVPLDTLPLTRTGKIDRRALPNVRDLGLASREEFVAPRDTHEHLLAAIWSEVLGIPEIGVRDNFFALGGNSLSATQVVARVRARTAAPLALRALFATPTIEGLARALRSDSTDAFAIRATMGNAASAGSAPLSLAQERLWFFDRLEQGSTTYNMHILLELIGDLDLALLEKSVNVVVERQAMLRTRFVESDGVPAQQVDSYVPIPLRVEDVSAIAEADRASAATATWQRETATEFDLAREHPLRVLVVRVSPAEHHLLVTLHHIAGDGTSLVLLTREIASAYASFETGAPLVLPALPFQYTDYARAQRDWLASPARQRALDYWRLKFSGNLPVLDLPTDRVRPPVQTFRGALAHAVVPPELTTRLRALSRRGESTLFVTMLSAFAALLYRHSGDEDIIIGTPLANREDAGTSNLIGLLINTIALRTDLTGNPSFEDLLRRVRAAAFDGFAHQELPLADLLGSLDLDRDPSRSPLFQVVFNMFLPNADQVARVGGIEIKPPSLDRLLAAYERQSKFDMTLYALESEGGVGLGLVYNTDLFAPERMAVFLEQYVRLLDVVSMDPHTRIGDVRLAEPVSSRVAHRHRTNAFVEKPGTFVDANVSRRFREVVCANAHRIALRSGSATMTYGQLGEATASLGAAIASGRRDPARPGRVGLLCGHTPAMVTAVLATLTAGDAYVPLDPAFPPERLAAIAADAEIHLLVHEPQYADLARTIGGDAVLLSTNAENAAGTPAAAIGPDSAAYILYTSGSTGKPKGVVQSHRGLLHHARVYANSIEITPDDRVGLIASYTFDASVMDLFGALLSGAELVLVDLRKDGVDALASEISAGGITVFHATPTVYRAVVAMLDSGAANAVRCVVLGGEAAHPRDVARFDEVFAPGTVLVNGLGPTESTTALQFFYDGCTPLAGLTVPVGRPVADTRVVLLDDAGNPTPVRGELAVESRFVAEGYWKQPELSAASFASAGTSGIRRYRTGDLARRRPDGTYEFLGRRDDQLKIRGVRIEPGEIEAALAAHPAVVSCAVVADQSTQRGTVLIGFVVLRQTGAASSEELVTHLAQRLPDYMVPAAVVALDALPLTRTGKIDRRALPSAKSLGIADQHEFVEPRDAVEQMLAEIWADVLARPRVGVRDNFFALGGTSLNATQVVARVHALQGATLELRSIFTSPTIEGLAAILRAADGTADHAAPVLRRRSGVGDTPLSFSQQRMWFLHQIMPQETAYNIVAGVQLVGALDRDALRGSLDDITARHESLRSTFWIPADEPRQRVAASASALVIEHDVTHLPADERLDAAGRIATDLAMRPFDLENGPLWWALVIRVAEDRHYLRVGVHHIIGDLWSFGVIARELAQFYNARVRREAAVLPPTDIEYGDYSVWQLEWLSGARLDREFAYWKVKLRGIAPLEFPTDRPRPPLQTANGDRRPFAIDADVIRRVRALSVREAATPFMVFFAAFNVALRRWTGQDDIAVGVPIANRTHVGVESLVGTFVNTLVHRNDLSGNPTFREALHRVRSVALDAFSHQDLPFERLVRELAPERDPSRSPLFQIMFNMANAPGMPLPMEGLTLEPLFLDRKATQFDIGLSIAIGERSGGFASFNTDLFDAPTIERFLLTFVSVLEAGTRNPDQTIDQLPVMSDVQRVALVQAQGESTPAVTGSVVALAEAQAKRTPDAVAVESGKSSLTFAELDARANRLARHLRANGVSDGSLVGVCLQRSPDMVVALLAVLKAGAAYVPVDPEYPSHRVRFMLEDSGAVAVIAQKATLDRLPETKAVVVALDRDAGAIASESSAALDVVPSVDALAYVLYTSGSTGNPKGVEIPHGALSNFLMSMARTPGLTAKDTLLAVTTISFDIAGLELYLPLVTGATIVLAGREVASDAKRLRDLLVKRQPTVMQATPATWRGLIDAGWAVGDTPGLKVLCGGEALPRELANELLPRVAEVWNMYGPTETTIWSTVERVANEPGPVSIGRPIANTRVYVLDAAGELLPVGVPGELYIGGAGVARGYHGRPDLTEARFVVDPFAADGSRMYRTGDRARVRPDGALEHLGRLDFQVKVRGYRIELGEVESALAQLPAVAQCVVDVRHERLVAYVVFAGGEQLTASEVRAHLRETLPDYMVPSLVVPLEKFPLTPNGKVDRRALPDPLRTSARTASSYVLPATPTETIIASVWKELLGVERVSVDDNFFELGGHSLLSVRAVHEIQQRTGWRPDPRLLFFETLGKIASTRPVA